MNQRGFTLLEMLVAMAVGGLALAAAVPTIYQMTQGTARISGSAAALADMDSAAHWLTRDVVQAQTTDLTDGAPPVAQMTLTWQDLTSWAVDEGAVSHTATFTYDSLTGELERNYNNGQQITTVARHLTRADFSLQGDVVTITLTSSPDSYVPRPTETRTYVINMRPTE